MTIPKFVIECHVKSCHGGRNALLIEDEYDVQYFFHAYINWKEGKEND